MALPVNKSRDPLDLDALLISKENLLRFLETLSELLSEEEFSKLVENFNNGELPRAPEHQVAELNPLTAQEQKIVFLLIQGMRNNQIAEELGISVNTARTHRNNIHKKLKIRSGKINPMPSYEQYVKQITKTGHAKDKTSGS